jgi:hypothetical protein
MKPRTRSALVIVSIVWALALASCTSGSGPEPAPPLGPVAVVHGVGDLVLPLDAYRLTNKEYVAMGRAHARLTADCMHRFGVDLPIDTDSPVVGVNVPDFDNINERRYGLIDPDSAAMRGYLAPAAPGDDPAADIGPRKGNGPDPTPHILFLLSGKRRPEFADAATMPTDTSGRRLPDDGCQGEAERTLAGGPHAANLTVAETYANAALRRAENDNRQHAAVAAWSTCMQARGYRYSSIWEPNDANWPRPPGAEEIATAKADVDCKVQTNLAGIWLAVESAYQRREIERHSQELTALRRYLDNVVRNSARVVGG